MNFKLKKAIMLSALAASLLTFTGCGGSEGDTNTFNYGTEGGSGGTTGDTGGGTVIPPEVAEAGDINLPGPTACPATTVETITVSGYKVCELPSSISSNLTLPTGNFYRITSAVLVENGVTLTIEEGTQLFGTTGAYLAVKQGAKLNADATAERPIIFTSEVEVLGGAAGQGQWGGVTLLGRAQTNKGEESYEADTSLKFGSSSTANNTESSGVLRNVYIKNTGYEVSTDAELNGLSLAGVGSGTIVESVTVENGADDGIELWGGTVQLQDITIVNAFDDSLDWDHGWTGGVNGLNIIQSIVKDDGSRGIEADNDGSNHDGVPRSNPTIENFSISTVSTGGQGIYLREGTGAKFINGTVNSNASTPGVAALMIRNTATRDNGEIAFSGVTLNASNGTKFEGKDGVSAAETQSIFELGIACPTGTTQDGTLGSKKVCVLPSSIASNLTLSSADYYRIDGAVLVEDGVTLTVPAGITVYGTTGSYLAVKQGGKLYAEGRSNARVVFTSETEVTGGASAQGQWGGLTLLGRAQTNKGEESYEADTSLKFGSASTANNAESSGILRYVTVKNTGYEVSTDAELNGLSLAGVGSGTIIENIIVENGADDGIELWGGTVALKDITINNAFDDSLDWDHGWTGSVDGLTITQTMVKDDGSRGIEADNDGSNHDGVPRSNPTIRNFSITTTATGGQGIYLREGTGAKFYDGVVNSNAATPGIAALMIRNTATRDNGEILFTGVELNSANGTDFEGKDGVSAAETEAIFNAGVACAPGTTEELGLNGKKVCTLPASISANMSLSAVNYYKISGAVLVESGAILTIAEGTTLFGTNGAYLAVKQGAQINADGTAVDPIIFTSETAVLGGADGQGQWGGLTILGRAQTNKGEESYEADTSLKFGSASTANNTESSGVLRYVTVKNTGYEVSTDAELNGLSLAGVGSGTIVENITVENGADDGIELWGGTVALKDITINNAFDDSLDWDHGWTGSVDGLTITQNIVKDDGSRGIEADNDGSNHDGVPRSNPDISNFSITTVANGGEGIYLREGTGAKFTSGVVNSNSNVPGIAALMIRNTATRDNGEIAFTGVTLNSTNGINFSGKDGVTAAETEAIFNQ